jgi:hypothetical protein
MRKIQPLIFLTFLFASTTHAAVSETVEIDAYEFSGLEYLAVFSKFYGLDEAFDRAYPLEDLSTFEDRERRNDLRDEAAEKMNELNLESSDVVLSFNDRLLEERIFFDERKIQFCPAGFPNDAWDTSASLFKGDSVISYLDISFDLGPDFSKAGCFVVAYETDEEGKKISNNTKKFSAKCKVSGGYYIRYYWYDRLNLSCVVFDFQIN